MQNLLGLESYKYQLLQHTEVRITFSVMFFQDLKTINFLQQKLCLMTKPLSTLITPILEEQGPNDMLFQENGRSTCAFSHCVLS
jgi:hypothetical protein